MSADAESDWSSSETEKQIRVVNYFVDIYHCIFGKIHVFIQNKRESRGIYLHCLGDGDWDSVDEVAWRYCSFW